MLNRAVWSSYTASRILLRLLVSAFVPPYAPVVVGLDDHPAPPPTHRRGRPRLKGARQPTLAARLSGPATLWQEVSVRWYGGTTRRVRLASALAVWYHSGLPPVSIRWVLVSDPDGKFESQALLSTGPNASPTQIVESFVQRWQLEVTFQEARAHLGIETQRPWSDLAILRTTPALLGLFSLVTLFAHLARLTDALVYAA